jgi:hypothetical protein
MLLDRLKQFGVAVAAALMLCASSAGAVTVQVVATNQAALDLLDPSKSLDLGGGYWDPARTAVMGSVSGQWRSPWENDTNNNDPEYWTAGPSPAGSPNLPNPAVLKYDTAQTSFSLLWGSVDTYNELRFFDAGGEIALVLGQAIINLGATQGLGAALVGISGLDPFIRVEFFSNGSNAFEFSNIAVPLPGALLLLLTAIGGLGVVGRLKARAA